MNKESLIKKYEDRKKLLETEYEKMLGNKTINVKKMCDFHISSFAEFIEDIQNLKD